MIAKLTPPLKWHGGKNYLAKRIIELMPPRCKNPNAPSSDDPGWLHYVEPFFGGGAVLLANDPEGISEVANDLNFGLSNFWRVLQSERHFAEFHRMLEATPFSEAEFNGSEQDFDAGEPVLSAANFFIRCRQSLSGRMKGFAGITRNRTRRCMNEQVSAWLNTIEGLPEVHARLKRVLIRNRPAIEVIKAEDGPRTLFYCDPPYLHETRATTGEYAHEMTNEQHRELLAVLLEVEGKVALSGYHSAMYDEALRDWTCHDFDLPNNAAGGGTKRRMVEAVWCNFKGTT